MKKISLYLILIAIGLALGYLFFGSSEPSTVTQAAHDHQENAQGHAHGQKHDDVAQIWTCPMHPQVRKSEPGDCPICGMPLVPLNPGGLANSDALFRMDKEALALANVETSKVGTGSFSGGHIELSGKIRADEKTQTTQVTHFAGRIEKLYINAVGERIHKGQILADIYSPALVSAQQELLIAASSKESNPGLYQAVRKKLKLWEITDAQIDQIEASGKIKDSFPIHATLSGTVTKKLVKPGMHVRKGEPLFQIVDLSTVWAVFDAYESQIDELKVGQSLEITSKAYPGKSLDGQITFIAPLFDPATRTVKVRALLKNPTRSLKPGMFVKAEVSVPVKKDSILSIPKSAVLWTGKRSVVYVKPYPDKSIFELREVTLGQETANRYQILSGLTKGEAVVTNGTFTVDAEAQLQGKISMMHR